MTQVRIGMLGAGTVGAEVVRLLQSWSDDLAARAGSRLVVSGIAVADPAKPRPDWIDPGLLCTDPGRVIADSDVVVELIGGIEPARTLVLEALGRGASVVTANKALMATHGPELFDAARDSGVDLYFEAAVAGAVPVVYAMRESLAGDEVTRVLGIVNGTTNYILDAMTTHGTDLDTALAQAQQAGYAEADPSADVDGLDAAAKAALLASLAFHSRVALGDVDCTGIRAVTQAVIRAADQAGFVVKLLASCDRLDGAVSVRVGPTLVPREHPLAAVRGVYNAVLVEATAAGRLMFYGRGAGGPPTASAVLSDVVAAAQHRVFGGRAPLENPYAGLPVVPPNRAPRGAQVRLAIDDRAGTLAHLAGSFGAHDVSIESLRQDPAGADGRAELSLITHPAPGADLDAVIAELRADPRVAGVLSVLPVEAS